jgi:hypothetical protein
VQNPPKPDRFVPLRELCARSGDCHPSTFRRRYGHLLQKMCKSTGMRESIYEEEILQNLPFVQDMPVKVTDAATRARKAKRGARP